MKNPWEQIDLSDYENHMKSGSVLHLQAMNTMMTDQLYRYLSRTIMILGVAGGNGLEHIDPALTETVYGVDINNIYLEESQKRYENLAGIFSPLCIDLTDGSAPLPNGKKLVRLDYCISS